MTEPTPGPWKLHRMGSQEYDLTSGHPTRGGTFLGLNAGRGAPDKLEDDDQAEFEANARLIEAALDMHDLIAATGDTIANVFEQMLKGNWVDDHGHDVRLNSEMLALKDRLSDAIELRAPFVEAEPSHD